MTAGQHARSDHGPYIAAVCRSIRARDISVAGTGIGTSSDHGRDARLALRPGQDAFAEPVPDEAAVLWDEECGWSLLGGGSRITKGLDVLPDPADVAAWVVVALTHPELTPSYEDGPLRARDVPDPEFEARLARYAATA